MAYAPIAHTIPQYEDYPNHWLKAYEQGTVNPLAMATDATGTTTASRFELNTEGFPVTNSNALVIPFIDGDYDLWLFPTAAEADANDTTNALQFADNLNSDPQSGVGASVPQIATLAALIARTTLSGSVFVLGRTATSDGYEGNFTWSSDDQSATGTGNVPADTFQGVYVAPASDTTGASGAWKRSYVGAVDIVWFGAKFDAGVTDNTAAIQAAVNIGKSVFLEPVDDPTTEYYKVTSAINLQSNQRIFSNGPGAIIRQSTPNTNVLQATSKTKVEVYGLHLYCHGTLSSINNGQGVHLDGCSECKIKGNVIENNRGYGIGIKDTNDSWVTRNEVINSPVVDTDTHDQTTGDISVYYSSSRNKIYKNTCHSGNGVGISIQSIDSGDTCNDNIVEGNHVYDMRVYGIQAYRLNGTDFVLRNNIVGNTVTNISGAVANLTSGNVYGAGIYVQAAEYTTVSDNTIDETNAQTVVELLSPGAIGATNVTNVTITGNMITNADWFGITVRDPTNQGIAVGSAIVTDNNISTCGKSGIHVLERGKMLIGKNTIDGALIHGVAIDNTVATDPTISILDNIILNSASIGINVTFASQLKIINNAIDTSGVSGIVVANSDDVDINENTVRNSTVRGIHNQTTNTSVNILGNNVNANSVGMLIQSRALQENNRVESNTTDWQGDYAGVQATAPALGTWVVGDRVYNSVPAAGGALSWTCTTAGTPGTWKGLLLAV